MTVSGVSTSNQAVAMGLIDGSGQIAGSQSVGDVAAMGQGTDSAQFSKGAQMMSKLKQLQSSDPEQFKAVAQKISDNLASAAKSATDSDDASHLQEMSDDFAKAAKSGDMSSLAPKQPPMGMAASGEAGKAAGKFNMAKDHAAFFNTVDSIVENALSGATDSTGTTGAAA